jgi:hypothetical protein
MVERCYSTARIRSQIAGGSIGSPGKFFKEEAKGGEKAVFRRLICFG